MARTRLMHLLTSFNMGGAEQVACNLLRFIDGERFERSVCSLSGPGPMEQRFRESGIETCCITPRGAIGSIWQLRRLLREKRIEILHCHNRTANINGAPAGRLAGVPVVVCTRHMAKDFRQTGRKFLLERIVAPMTDYYIAVSQGVFDNAAATGRIHPERARVIYNSVDTHLYSPNGAAREQAGPVVIGCVARLSEEKRHCDLLDALALLKKEGLAVRLHLVGDGAERAALEQQVGELRISGDVRFLGARKDVPELLREFDIFALASRLEGLPLALVEAMAAGLPLVATDVGSIKELVREKNGVLCPPREPKSLAAALSRLVKDGNLRKHMGNASRARAAADFDLRAAARKHEELYLELLSKKGHVRQSDT